MKHVNPSDVKPYLAAFATMLSMSKLLLPPGKVPQVDTIVNRLTEVAQSDWCSDLICYLVNTFGDSTTVSQQELGAALKQFGHVVQSGQEPPRSFNVGGNA